PYGHGRVEILTGLLLGFLLAGAGCAIAWHGLTGAADERQAPALWGVWALIFLIGIQSWVVFLKSGQARKIGSSSLLADAVNDGIDILSGIVALAALSLALFDPTRFLRADH